MTKKVLILSLNYSSTPAIALSGRINIAVNARGVFIADYGILEENITYLTDEWTPLTKVHIMAAIQALVDESTSLEEIYIYYAGYGSGIQIVKSIDWALMPQPVTIYPPLIDPPLIDPPLTVDPSSIVPPQVIDISGTVVESTTLLDPTITITIDELETPVEPPVEPPVPYRYDFYPMTQSYDKLTKQMVGSDYGIITNSEILDMLKNTRCRTICVLDMCHMTYEVSSLDTLTWGTDIIGNVNIISFAEPDSISSGKLATIQVITQHLFTNPAL
jgi:hypothetical protein